MISHTHQNYRLANFPTNKSFLKLDRHLSSTHIRDVSGVVGITNAGVVFLSPFIDKATMYWFSLLSQCSKQWL